MALGDLMLACFVCFGPGVEGGSISTVGVVVLMAAPYAVLATIGVLLYRNYRGRAQIFEALAGSPDEEADPE